MRFSIFKMCVSAFVLISISGCSSSLVYSPSLNLPAAPLKKEQGQVIAGGLMLPETRPHTQSSSTIFGLDGTVRYAFSDKLSLGVKGWADMDELTDNFWRGGISVHGIFKLNSSESSFNYGIIPTVAFLNHGESFDGGGGSIAFATWFPKIGNFTPYAAFGPAIGIRDIDTEWGYGAIGNIGAAMEVFKNFTLNAEVAGIIQVNQYDNITHGIISPSVAIGWTF